MTSSQRVVAWKKYPVASNPHLSKHKAQVKNASSQLVGTQKIVFVYVPEKFEKQMDFKLIAVYCIKLDSTIL